MSTVSKEKRKKLERQKKRSLITVIIILSLAVLILIINLLSFSYSWFTPSSDPGQGLSFDQNYQIRSENCTFTTFQGEVVTSTNQSQHPGYKLDQVAYSGTAIPANEVISVPAGERVYFRTEIQNNDTKYPSVVSLYHTNMPANLAVAVTYPSNTYHFVGTEADLATYFGAGATTWPDYFIIRNAYVKVKDQNDVDGPGLLPVEWFVENRSSSAVTIRVTPYTSGGVTDVELYLMYN